MVVDSPQGTKLLLQKLAMSPLVRRNLPNAAAICSQYFAFRRNPQESIGNFLVRETLIHEEFVEALIRLWEDKQGLGQENRDFGLPADDEGWDDEAWGHGWDWYYDEEEPVEGDEGDTATHGATPGAEEPSASAAPSAPSGPAASTGPPTMREAPRATTGSSPSHRGDPERAPSESPQHESSPKEPPTALDELTMANSFILSVLRGWRLLQAAGLSPDEMRDILSSTKNSMDYDLIAAALQNLWDDQLLGSRTKPKPYYPNHAHYVGEMDDSELYYQEEGSEWDGDGSWWEDGYAYYTDQSYQDDWWHDE